MIEKKSEIPTCPITKKPLREPVIATDGFTYEKDAIKTWFKKHQTSPVTQVYLQSKSLIPNYSIKAMASRINSDIKKFDSEIEESDIKSNIEESILKLQNDISRIPSKIRLPAYDPNPLLGKIEKFDVLMHDWEQKYQNAKGNFVEDEVDNYHGEVKQGQKHGKGEEKFNDKLCYYGEWVNDKREGLGREYYEDGSQYRGYWKDGKRNGFGIYTYKSGATYNGYWKDDQQEGEAIQYFGPDKNKVDRYEGFFSKGQRHGQGNYYYHDGEWYKGQWERGRKHGLGKFRYNEDTENHPLRPEIIEGRWNRGRRVIREDNDEDF